MTLLEASSVDIIVIASFGATKRSPSIFNKAVSMKWRDRRRRLWSAQECVSQSFKNAG